jgi:uncharacterized protein YdaU (DUF1376 family)
VRNTPNYFKFHLGDYARDCEELSMLQHGAYLGLMRWYYAAAKPFPNDLDRIYRRTDAHSTEERNAVMYVLENFFDFDLAANVWRHKRIEAELADWNVTSDTARDAANRRWKKAHKNKESSDANAMRAQSDGNALHNHNHIKHTTAASPADIPGFEEFCAIYPKRAGGNPKRRAQKAYHARLKEGHGPDEILAGAKRYAAFVRGIKKDGTQYVMQYATFLGPDKHFLDAWELPQAAENPMYSRWGVM